MKYMIQGFGWAIGLSLLSVLSAIAIVYIMKFVAEAYFMIWPYISRMIEAYLWEVHLQ